MFNHHQPVSSFLQSVEFSEQQCNFSSLISGLIRKSTSPLKHFMGPAKCDMAYLRIGHCSLLLTGCFPRRQAVQRDNSLNNCIGRHSKRSRKLISSGRKLSNSDSRRENPIDLLLFLELNAATLLMPRCT